MSSLMVITISIISLAILLFIFMNKEWLSMGTILVYLFNTSFASRACAPKMKKFYPKLYCFAVTFMFGVIWALPLRRKLRFTKLTLQDTLISYETSIVILIFISGFISYIVAKVHQYIKGKGNVVNFKEFIYIFTVSMVITIFFIILGA
uniref:hypothetical protein n=1 Tax=Diaporthe caulivora TaxID=60444 RepID=UPI002410CEB2|nr:hypothetical protein P8516_mgp24 [Diaporthe caulivora]WEH01730.1 hypothetical protein [Diaporthe caulivora]